MPKIQPLVISVPFFACQSFSSFTTSPIEFALPSAKQANSHLPPVLQNRRNGNGRRIIREQASWPEDHSSSWRHPSFFRHRFYSRRKGFTALDGDGFDVGRTVAFLSILFDGITK